MFVLLWNLSAALSGYLRDYAPTNRAIDWLRTPSGLKWGVPVALVASPIYLGLMWLAADGATHQGLGWLNILVILFFWNAMKFAVMAVLGLPAVLVRVLRGSALPLLRQTRGEPDVRVSAGLAETRVAWIRSVSEVPGNLGCARSIRPGDTTSRKDPS